VLFIIIGFLGYRFYNTWMKPLGIIEQPTVTEKETEKKAPEDKGTKEKDRRPPPNYYDLIVKKDLFRPSRTSFIDEGKVVETSSKDKPKLFGTIIMNNERHAILEDPNTKITRMYTINDSVAGYTINDIEEDRVILTKAGNTYEVKLREIKEIKFPAMKPPPVTPQRRPRRQHIRRPNTQQRNMRRQRITPPPPPPQSAAENPFTEGNSEQQENIEELQEE
jgi:type II secretory pathway component PulC